MGLYLRLSASQQHRQQPQVQVHNHFIHLGIRIGCIEVVRRSPVCKLGLMCKLETLCKVEARFVKENHLYLWATVLW